MHNIFINIEYVYLISTGIHKDQETLDALNTLLDKTFHLNIIYQDKTKTQTVIKSRNELKSFIKTLR
jgi:hypothetical protein